MTMQFIRTLVWSVLAALVAATLISLALWAAERLDRSPRSLLSNEMRVVKGVAVATDSGLQITGLDAEGVAMVISPLGNGIPAKRYPAIQWSVGEGASAQGYALIWVTAAEPQSLQSLPLTPAQFFAGRFELQADPRWQGDIVGAGIALLDVPTLPLSIDRFELDPVGSQWSWLDSSRQLAARLGQFEPWLPSSINFHRGGVERSWVSPATLAAAWVLLSVLILASLRWLTAVFSLRLAAIVVLALGWLALDLRWTAELLARAQSPAVDVRGYLGVNAASWLEQLPDRLGEDPRRVFLIDDAPTGARALRARYLLSPHSVLLGFSDLPDSTILRGGDVIVILSAPIPIRFDSRQNRLFSASGRSLSASLVSSATGAGFAFSVDGSQVVREVP